MGRLSVVKKKKRQPFNFKLAPTTLKPIQHANTCRYLLRMISNCACSVEFCKRPVVIRTALAMMHVAFCENMHHGKYGTSKGPQHQKVKGPKGQEALRTTKEPKEKEGRRLGWIKRGGPGAQQETPKKRKNKYRNVARSIGCGPSIISPRGFHINIYIWHFLICCLAQIPPFSPSANLG